MIAQLVEAGENVGMIDRFEIVGSGSPRPEAERIIFCDGTGGELFHADTDLELSHWRPNCTAPRIRLGKRLYFAADDCSIATMAATSGEWNRP